MFAVGTRIAVIEDDAVIADAVAARLRSVGYEVDLAADGPAGVDLVERTRPDLVVLDIGLPGFDGLEVCRRIQRDRHVPVVMLTALDDETDLIVGLKVGADDYVTKPFSPRELVARIETVLRRAGRVPVDDALVVGDLRIHPAERRVLRHGQAVHLTATEFDLVRCLAEAAGSVMSREGLLAAVWGYRAEGSARTVDSHVRSVRQKLGASAVRTVHGVGYAIGSGLAADEAVDP